MRPLIASVVRVPWHTRHGGYDRLLDYLPEALRITPPTGRVAQRAIAIAHTMGRRWCALPFYPSQHFATDLRVLASPGPAHVLYGDEQFWFSRHRLGPTAVTYHQPSSCLAQLLPHAVWRKLVPRADRIIVLDPQQRAFFADYLPIERLHVVPHGIDTAVFRPADTPGSSGRPLVLTVGWWLRDWDVLDRVHERLHRRYSSQIELAVVTRQARARPWHPAARVLEGISEQQLITLYRRAAVVLLPLKDASANNALLEALACATPVVATDVGGIPYYTGDTQAVVLTPPGDAPAVTEAVEKILAEAGSAHHAARRAAARNRAEQFAWPLVADRVRAVHQLLQQEAP